MSLREWLSPYISNRNTSVSKRDKRRAKFEAERQRAGEPHQVYYYHQPDDPYSQLTLQLLPDFAEHYEVDIKAFLAPPTDKADAPQAEQLKAYAERDARALASHYQLQDPESVHHSEYQQFFVDTDAETVEKQRRSQHHHFSGALFHYGNENYWLPDRLHYLTTRLTDLGAQKKQPDSDSTWGRVTQEIGDPALGTHTEPVQNSSRAIDFYPSVRSPYTYLLAQRLFAYADSHNIQVNMKPVLPMMMRGVPASIEKQRYFVFDTKREAMRHGLEFGRIADPFGEPAKRGLCLLFFALEQDAQLDKNLGRSFLLSFLQGVWSEGIRAGTDSGLKKIATRAGLDWADCKNKLQAPQDWQKQAEHNRDQLFKQGLWGVPTITVGDDSVWGQDRLWLVHQLLNK